MTNRPNKIIDFKYDQNQDEIEYPTNTTRPHRNSILDIMQDDYIQSNQIAMDQSQFVQKSGQKIICERYFQPVQSKPLSQNQYISNASSAQKNQIQQHQSPDKYIYHSGNKQEFASQNQMESLEARKDPGVASAQMVNWKRQLTNLIPQDDYISYARKADDDDASSWSKKSSVKNLSILEDKDDNSYKWRNSIGGTYSATYRTKADSGPEISWMENSGGGYTERKSRLSYESNPRIKEQIQKFVPNGFTGFLGSIKNAIGAPPGESNQIENAKNAYYYMPDQSPHNQYWMLAESGSKTVRKETNNVKSGDQIKCNELLAESFCIIEHNKKELNNDCQHMNSPNKFKPSCQRRFTFDETLRGETPFGQPIKRQIGAKQKNIQYKNKSKYLNLQDQQPNQTKYSDSGVFQPIKEVSKNESLQIKIKTKEGHIIDFKNDSSPIRSRRSEDKKTFNFQGDIQDSESDQNSDFSIKDSDGDDQEIDHVADLPQSSNSPFGFLAKNGNQIVNCKFKTVSEIETRNQNKQESAKIGTEDKKQCDHVKKQFGMLDVLADGNDSNSFLMDEDQLSDSISPDCSASSNQSSDNNHFQIQADEPQLDEDAISMQSASSQNLIQMLQNYNIQPRHSQQHSADSSEDNDLFQFKELLAQIEVEVNNTHEDQDCDAGILPKDKDIQGEETDHSMDLIVNEQNEIQQQLNEILELRTILQSGSCLLKKQKKKK